jgi:hypothetical protein
LRSDDFDFFEGVVTERPPEAVWCQWKWNCGTGLGDSQSMLVLVLVIPEIVYREHRPTNSLRNTRLFLGRSEAIVVPR